MYSVVFISTPLGDCGGHYSKYHASIRQVLTASSTGVALMPLFIESARSVAMIKYSMHAVKAETEYPNH